MYRALTSMTSISPKRFAPLKSALNGNNGEGAKLPPLRGVVFDMDGTLCEPQTYMFTQMRSYLEIPKTVDILEHIDSLPPEQQEQAHEAIRSIERSAMEAQTPQPGLLDLMSYLESRGIPKAICTRNFAVPVQHLLDKFLRDHVLHPVITREFRPAKPHPAGILHIADSWGLRDAEGASDATGLIMVGDSVDDMTAGRLAGAATVLVVNDVNQVLATHPHTDMVIKRLDELIEVLDRGFEGRSIETENPMS